MRLFFVGIAWGFPCLLVPALTAGLGPQAAVYPAVASIANGLQPVVFAAPLLAIIGVALVTRYSSRAPALSLASLLAVAVAVGSAVAILFADPTQLAVLQRLPLIAATIGLSVTVAVLWRHSRWAAAVFATVWMAICSAMIVVGSRVTPFGDGVGSGPLYGLLALGGLVASAIAAALAFMATGMAAGHRARCASTQSLAR